MDAQHHADLLHPLQRRVDVADVGDARRAVGGGAGRVELGGDPHARLEPARELVRVGVVGQVAGHQRREARARGGDDPVAIGRRRFDAGHRRREVGHDDRPRELPRRIRRHRFQHVAVAQMHVPIVGPADGQRLHCHGGSLTEAPCAATTLTDRAVIRLSGEGVRDFLQGLVTSDVAGALPVWAGLLTPQGKCLFDFLVWAGRRRPAARLRSRSRRRFDQAPRRSTACAAPIGIERDPSLAVHWSLDGGEGVPDPRLPELGRRWLAPAVRSRRRLARASPPPRRHRRPRRTRRHPLARMQCGGTERRQLLQGLLRRPGKHRADELAAKVNRRLVVVEGRATGPRTRARISRAGLAGRSSPRRRPRRRHHPDWLQPSITA